MNKLLKLIITHSLQKYYKTVLFFLALSFLLITCGDNPDDGGPPAVTPRQNDGDGNLSFLKADNPFLLGDINLLIKDDSKTNYVFYLDQTAADVTNLSLKGKANNFPSENTNNIQSITSITPVISGALDYETPKTFSITINGNTKNIVLQVFRKPTVEEANYVNHDIVSLDFLINSDRLRDGVFALFRSDVNITSADDILDTATKFTRNLDYQFIKEVKSGKIEGNYVYKNEDEYLLGYHASTTVAGSDNDVTNTLNPATDYSLYFAHEFANGKKWLKLMNANTEAVTTLPKNGDLLVTYDGINRDSAIKVTNIIMATNGSISNIVFNSTKMNLVPMRMQEEFFLFTSIIYIEKSNKQILRFGESIADRVSAIISKDYGTTTTLTNYQPTLYKYYSKDLGNGYTQFGVSYPQLSTPQNITPTALGRLTFLDFTISYRFNGAYLGNATRFYFITD